MRRCEPPEGVSSGSPSPSGYQGIQIYEIRGVHGQFYPFLSGNPCNKASGYLAHAHSLDELHLHAVKPQLPDTLDTRYGGAQGAAIRDAAGAKKEPSQASFFLSGSLSVVYHKG